MVRLIVSIVLLIVLAAFVALNVQYTATVNIFGLVVENTSVVAVVLISLVVGILFSFVMYLFNYIVKSRREKLKERSERSKVKEKELAKREKEIVNVERQVLEPTAEETPGKDKEKKKR